MGNLLCVPTRSEEADKAGPTTPRKKRNVRHWFRKKVLKRRSGVAVPPSALSLDEYDDASSTDYDVGGLPSYREVNLAALPCSIPCEERDEVTPPQSSSLVVRSSRHVVVSSPSLDTIYKAAVAFLRASSLSVRTPEYKSITRSRSAVVVTIRPDPPQPSSSLTSAVGFVSRSRLGCVILAGVVPSDTSVVVSTAVLAVTCTTPIVCTTSPGLFVVRSVNVVPQTSLLPLPGSSRPTLTWEPSTSVAASPPRIPNFLVQTSLSVSTPTMSPSPESPISAIATGRIPSLTCMALTWRPGTSLTSLPEIPSSLLMPSGRLRVVGCMQPPPSPDLSTPSPWTPSGSPQEFPSLPSSPLVPDTSPPSSPELPRPDPPPGLSGIQNRLVPSVQLMSRHTVFSPWTTLVRNSPHAFSPAQSVGRHLLPSGPRGPGPPLGVNPVCRPTKGMSMEVSLRREANPFNTGTRYTQNVSFCKPSSCIPTSTTFTQTFLTLTSRNTVSTGHTNTVPLTIPVTVVMAPHGVVCSHTSPSNEVSATSPKNNSEIVTGNLKPATLSPLSSDPGHLNWLHFEPLLDTQGALPLTLSTGIVPDACILDKETDVQNNNDISVVSEPSKPPITSSDSYDECKDIPSCLKQYKDASVGTTHECQCASNSTSENQVTKETELNQDSFEFRRTVQNSTTDKSVKSPTHSSTQSNELVPHISARESVSKTVDSIHTVQSTSVYVPSVQQTSSVRWSTSEDDSSERVTGEANRCDQTNKAKPGQCTQRKFDDQDTSTFQSQKDQTKQNKTTTSIGTTNGLKRSQTSEDGLPWSPVLSNQSVIKLHGVSSLNTETISSTKQSNKIRASSKRQVNVLGPVISHNRPIPAIPRTAGSDTAALKDIPCDVGPMPGPSTSRKIGQNFSSNIIQKRSRQQQQTTNFNISKEALKMFSRMDTGREQSAAQCPDPSNNFVITGGHVPQPPSIPRPDQTASSRRQVKMTECKKEKNKDGHVNIASESYQQNSYNKEIEYLPPKIKNGEKVKKLKEALGPPVNDENTDRRPTPSKELKCPPSPKPHPAMDAMNSKTFISSMTGRQQQAPPRLSALGTRTSDPVANPANAFPAIPGCSHTEVTRNRKDTFSLTTFREREVEHEDQLQKTQSASDKMRDMFEQKRRMRFKDRDQDVLTSPTKKLLSLRQNIQLPSCSIASQNNITGSGTSFPPIVNNNSTGSGTSFPPIFNNNMHCHPVPSTSHQTPPTQHTAMGQRNQDQGERDNSPSNAGSEPALQQFQSMCRLVTRFTNDSHIRIIRQKSPRPNNNDLSRQSEATTRASSAQDSALSNEQLRKSKTDAMAKSSRAATVSKERRNDKRNTDTVRKNHKGRFEGRSLKEKEFIKKVADKMSDFVIRPKTPRYFAFRRDRPPPTRNESKVSEFELPERPAAKSNEPLEFKDPEPHIYNIPDVAREDARKWKNWKQVEGKGPDAQQPWTNRRPLFDVALPKVGPGLLKQRGSIQKIEDDGVIPYGRQMEHLKLELCKFPGKRIPVALRDQYKVPEWAKPKPPKQNADGTEQQQEEEVDDDSDSDSEATGSIDAQSLEDIVADDVFDDDDPPEKT